MVPPAAPRRKACALLLTVLAAFAIPAPASARIPVDLPRPGSGGPQALYAIRPPHQFTHNVGQLALQVTNLGFVGNPYLPDDLSAGWRGGEYLFFSGLWIGAIGADAEPHVSTGLPLELRPDLDPVWTIRESFEGADGGRRVLRDPAVADDDGDGRVDEDFHDGLDNDGDGRIDEDYGAIGSQMFSCVYRDDTQEAVANTDLDHTALGLRVEQRTFQYASGALGEFVGMDFRIVNTGRQRLREVYLGWLSDSDVGPKTADKYWSDDRVGWDLIDTTLVDGAIPGACGTRDVRVHTAFMWDVPDDGGEVNGGDVPGVFGTLVLGHDTDASGIGAPRAVAPHTIDWLATTSGPTSDPARYVFMSSGLRPEVNPIPGSAAASSYVPDDYYYMVSVGPFGELRPGESLSLQLAHLVGEGFPGFRRNAVTAQRVFEGAYFDLDRNPETGIDGKERCLARLTPGVPLVWDDPCDTLMTPVEWDEDGCFWVDADCDPCTGINGQEAQIHWIAQLPLRNPGTNLDPVLHELPPEPPTAYLEPPAGNGRILLQWDNLPECFGIDLLTGEDVFEGYRVWRATDWPHPGGPWPGEWVQIGEFRRTPGPGSASLGDVRRNIPSYATTGTGCPLYPIGRYEYADTAGVVNCESYLYAVTAFGVRSRLDPGTGQTILEEITSLPASPLSHIVVPGDSCGVPVRLLSFAAERVGADARVRWEVTDARNHAGFDLYREVEDGARIRVNAVLFSDRSVYEFLDSEVPPDAASYWLNEIARTGERTWHGPAPLEPSALPAGLRVGRVSPNPFRAASSVTYRLPEARRVTVAVFDLSGRRMRVLVDATQGPGEHTATWEGRTEAGRSAPVGIYFLRVQAGSEARSLRMIRLR